MDKEKLLWVLLAFNIVLSTVFGYWTYADVGDESARTVFRWVALYTFTIVVPTVQAVRHRAYVPLGQGLAAFLFALMLIESAAR